MRDIIINMLQKHKRLFLGHCPKDYVEQQPVAMEYCLQGKVLNTIYSFIKMFYYYIWCFPNLQKEINLSFRQPTQTLQQSAFSAEDNMRQGEK